ncbi:MAG: HAMP domain-containing histidine kinase, partial [Chloroflexota bacterium]
QVSENLQARSDERAQIESELKRFGELLIKALESGDPGWLKPLLIEWAKKRTLTTLEKKEDLPSILSTIVLEIRREAKENLPTEDALNLIDSLLPIFSYCYEEIAYNEMLIRVSDVSLELEIATDELRKIDKSKSDFIAVAAHELKTPLTLIEGYASMLRDHANQNGEDSIEIGLLNGIDKGTQRLGEIVSDMIDVSMIDNNLLYLNFQPTWLYQLLESIEQEFSKSLSERNQTLVINEFEGIREMTFADSERIRQVLHNVISNAFKYTPDEGKIIVDGRLLGGFIEVLIIDEGIGVNPEDKDKIFEKFGSLADASLHSSGKMKFKGGGPGLGLPIVKGILDAHGGTIWVESQGYDEIDLPGSTFHILIPLRTEPPNEKLSEIFKTKDDKEPGE